MKRVQSTLIALVVGGLASGGALAACTRHADIRDERDGPIIVRPPELDAGGIPSVDSGINSAEHPPCLERPTGDCVGSNDFLCGFEKWVVETASACQEATGCVNNGWLEVKMSGAGCVEALGMDMPNDAMIDCLVAEMGAVRCPCPESVTQHYFGLSNDGTCE